MKKVAPEKCLGGSEGIPGSGTGISNSYQFAGKKKKFDRLRGLELQMSVLNDTHWGIQVTVSENREKRRPKSELCVSDTHLPGGIGQHGYIPGLCRHAGLTRP